MENRVSICEVIPMGAIPFSNTKKFRDDLNPNNVYFNLGLTFGLCAASIIDVFNESFNGFNHTIPYS